MNVSQDAEDVQDAVEENASLEAFAEPMRTGISYDENGNPVLTPFTVDVSAADITVTRVHIPDETQLSGEVIYEYQLSDEDKEEIMQIINLPALEFEPDVYKCVYYFSCTLKMDEDAYEYLGISRNAEEDGMFLLYYNRLTDDLITTGYTFLEQNAVERIWTILRKYQPLL